ncbi:hypothetical protein MNBD_IGNAVI01-1042 [hydrothermal vent metagenome]|uniref:histidine kinase n=1 Tax=hydrothermal vent metagenome TaxID=652676 RepID=A0A3B1D2G6_9ZZZZ
MSKYLSYNIAIEDIFDKSSDILSLIIDHNGLIIYANRGFSEILRLKSEPNLPKNYFTDFSDHLNSIEIKKIKNIVKTQRTSTFETVIGEKIYKFIITPKISSKSKVKFITIIGVPLNSDEESVAELKSNISGLNKQNNDLLELIEKLSLQNIELAKTNDFLNDKLDKKDKFFSILSHDLRGQMGNMINSSDLLVESFDSLDTKDVKNIISMLNKSVHKNYNILDDLLLWAYFERGKIKLNVELVKLNDIINNALESLTNDILKKSIQIINNVNYDIFAVCDLKHMEIILKKIISNAIKFSYPGNKVEISHNITDDEYIVIIITDYGTGMDENTFNDLFQIDKIHSNYGTEKETGGGTGLLVAKRILDEIEGKLEIITEPNQGTTVRIYCKKE